MGRGNVPAFTLRHNVAALNGNGGVACGRLGLRTRSASRSKALSGRWSKTDGVMVGAAVLLVMALTVAVRGGVIFADITSVLLIGRLECLGLPLFSHWQEMLPI